MSPDITLEIYFLFHSFLMGILITVLYDILRILRRMIRHNILAVSVEDFLYWTACSLIIFGMLIRENNGTLRWFAVAGAMAGMFLYKITIGFLFVKYVSLLLIKVLHIMGKLIRLILRPLKFIKKRLEWQGKQSRSRLRAGTSKVKKKLTLGKKKLRMILYKH
ncbi:spore cortex biosynthesis protein YabQ [Lachnospiraceae bacterium JLR.KK008]